MKYQFLGYHPIRKAYLLTVSAISDGFDAQIPFTDGGHGNLFPPGYLFPVHVGIPFPVELLNPR